MIKKSHFLRKNIDYLQKNLDKDIVISNDETKLEIKHFIKETMSKWVNWDKNYLDILTDKLIEKAVIIYQKRQEYIDIINPEVDELLFIQSIEMFCL
mgnify:CR=1 FL=1